MQRQGFLMSTMKKIILLLFILLISYSFYNLFVKTTQFTEPQAIFDYNNSTTSIESLGDSLVSKKIIKENYSFRFFALLFDIKGKTKSGKFLVKKGASLFKILRMMRNNQQPIVKFVLNKVRTRGELAKLLATTFSSDSAQYASFLNNNDSLAAFETDTTQLLTLFIPNTYEFYFSAPIQKVIQKMKLQKSEFWDKENRKNKASKIGMTIEEVYTLASIVEEETNYDSDKKLIASVYINRLKVKMPLQACPTIKYAMGDFTLTRIYEKYLSHPSLYNTYTKAGLPPGPICTPSAKTIDVVLDAPITTYLYFVAKADFSGYHHFSSTYEEHSKFAKQYQQKLDEYQKRKKIISL